MPLFNITKHFPSPILEDFQSFLYYFLNKEIKLTGSGYLPGKVCYNLNESMSMPSEESTPKQRHFYYPNLYLYYTLAINGQLLKTSTKGKSLYISPNLDSVEQFFDLSDTEQYIAILEILWRYTDWEVLHSPERLRSPAFRANRLLEKIATIKTTPTTLNEKSLGGFTWDLWPFAQYMEYLGFWVAGFESFDKTRFRHLETCRPSTFGIELARILTTKRRIDIWNTWESQEADDFSIFSFEQIDDTKRQEDPVMEEQLKEKFLTAFQHLFPKGELVNSLNKETTGFREGNHVFKVRFKHLPKIWRKVSIPAENSLHDLHLLIQEAVGFYDDHLYAFYPDNKRHSRLSYQSPFGDFGNSADEIRIGELQINENQPFLYFFDFGDSWEFEVVLEEIDRDSTLLKKGKIIESQGKAPEQYPDYDED